MNILADQDALDHPVCSDDLDCSHTIADALTVTKQHFQDFPEVPPMNMIIRQATLNFLEALARDEALSCEEIERKLLAMTNGVIMSVQHKAQQPAEKLAMAKYLSAWQIAQIMLQRHHLVRLRVGYAHGAEPLAIYMASGPERGLYVIDPTIIRQTARRYNASMTLRGSSEVMAILEEQAPRVSACSDPSLVAVNNGIYDLNAGELKDFDPSVVLLAKVRADYRADAKNPAIIRADGTSWDIETWMNELFAGDDAAERVDLAWHVLGAVCRPNTRWNKAVLLYNERGNNGKGTFMTLARALVGEASWGELSIADFADKFRLAEIVGKTAFGTDENDVGGFHEKMASFKACITGDTVSIERKNEQPYPYAARGLMVQCINSLPKSKDVSQSFYRRLLFWKFDKSFEGREDKAIRDDYLTRPEVLEYVLHKVLNLPAYDSLPEPPSSKEALAEFKESNDPVREFWAEVEDELVWDLLPLAFLHDLYTKWVERTNPRGGSLKRTEFYSRLRQIVAEDARWEDGQWGTSTRMDEGEPLVAEYDLTKWRNPTYSGQDPVKIGQPHLQAKYRGLLRAAPAATSPRDQDASG